jgi:pimeloyl-ACP methyl ester carboxylesterase
MSNHPASGELRDGDVIVNGIRLHYLDWGGRGAPIVLLHATGFLGPIYRPIAQALTAIGRVYSFDQRGHGDSERPRNDIYGWDLTAGDLEGFILAMGFEHVRAIGHSAGATAIGVVASGRPDLISRAMLIEPVIFDLNELALPQPNEMHARTLRRKRTFDSVEAMFRNFVNKPPYKSWRKEILRDYCERGTFVEADGKRALKCHPEVEAEIYATSRNFDGLGYIMRCDAPLLVLFGEHSDAPGLALAPRLAANNRRVVVVPGTSHFIPMEEPELTARMALEFLDGR